MHRLPGEHPGENEEEDLAGGAGEDNREVKGGSRPLRALSDNVGTVAFTAMRWESRGAFQTRDKEHLI